MKYEIYTGRFDVKTYRYKTFEADSDEDALKVFEEVQAMPSNAWDNMYMIAVEVERSTRRVSA